MCIFHPYVTHDRIVWLLTFGLSAALTALLTFSTACLYLGSPTEMLVIFTLFLPLLLWFRTFQMLHLKQNSQEQVGCCQNQLKSYLRLGSRLNSKFSCY